MAEQLWKGRFSKAVDSRVNDFNSSIRFDQRMIAQDMRGSGVHAAMLAKQGIISEKDCEDILSGLASIADDLASGALTIDPNAEDVHTFVEQTLTARIGDAGKRLHTGRSRNDQVALDIRLTLRDYSHTLQAYIVELVKVICRKAAENTTAVMPGYTHLQRAQPITFGHALMAYASIQYVAARKETDQVSLDAMSEGEVLDAIRRCQPDTLTPIEAMSLLYELKQKLSK